VCKVQTTVRKVKKRGTNNMDRRKIEAIPDWRKNRPNRLLVLAILHHVRRLQEADAKGQTAQPVTAEPPRLKEVAHG
jgi:catalase (peroxidase I)